MTADAPRCSGTNAKTGQPCRAWPLRGTTRCLAHSDAEARDSVGFVAANGKGGRPRAPRVVDVIRERLEARADAVIDVLWDGLEANRGVVVGSGEFAQLEETPDHGARLAAAREILDRAYGKPTQATEISGPDGGPVEVIDTSDPKTRKALHALLGQRPAARNG
jgi:hypothetical protein